MNQVDAETVAAWHYDGVYAFYDYEADPEDLTELLDPAARGDSMYSVRDDQGDMVGFWAWSWEGDVVDFGLGLRPDLTGQGIGAKFVEAGLGFVQRRFPGTRLQLRVAAFNKRAITVYKRAGFVEVERFINRTNGGEYEFIRMELMDHI
jgi:[ribosomal protein S18]-alanine N-acetyltransferase